jgi:hypothetical protein
VEGYTRNQMREAYEAGMNDRPQQVAVPAGYVLVPIEPTLEMIDASRCYSDKCGEYMIKTTPIGHYRAMLAAAQGAKP